MPPFAVELPAVAEVGHAQFGFPYGRLTGGRRKTRLRGGCQIAGDLPAWAGIRTALSRNFKEIIPFPASPGKQLAAGGGTCNGSAGASKLTCRSSGRVDARSGQRIACERSAARHPCARPPTLHPPLRRFGAHPLPPP